MPTDIFQIIGAVNCAIRHKELKGHCIQTSALLAKSLHAHGYPDAYLLTVGVDICNPAYFKWLNEHGQPTTDEQQAACEREGGFCVHLGAGYDRATEIGRWNGHLVVIVPNANGGRCGIIDLTLPQVNDMADEIDLEPLCSLLEPNSSFFDGNKLEIIQNECLLVYQAFPDDTSFKNFGDCSELPDVKHGLRQVTEIMSRSS